MKRSHLRLAKETLAELTDADLVAAVGGTDTEPIAIGWPGPTELCNPCLVTWSCDNIKTIYCLQTRIRCA